MWLSNAREVRSAVVALHEPIRHEIIQPIRLFERLKPCDG